MFDRIEEMPRLETVVKLPSKSPSTFPVITSFSLSSSHSKFAPNRDARAFKWNSGLAFGPRLVAAEVGGVGFSPSMPESGASRPNGLELSQMRLVLKNPYGW